MQRVYVEKKKEFNTPYHAFNASQWKSSPNDSKTRKKTMKRVQSYSVAKK